MTVEGRMVTATPRCSHALPVQWAQLESLRGDNKELSPMGIPSVQTLREWKQHCIRAAAGSWHDVKAAQVWIMEATNPDIDKWNLQTARVSMRLDMMLATNLLETFANMK
eukprot:4828644-Pyramimonas_sp.AAC.1